MKNRNISILLLVGLISCFPIQVAGQGSLTLVLDRNVGMALGSIIQGTFTLRGSGPESVQNLTVYFNGDEVHFVTGNSIAWQFNTADYPGGYVTAARNLDNPRHFIIGAYILRIEQ